MTKLDPALWRNVSFRIGTIFGGGYLCECLTCGKRFQGDKRAMSCLPCAIENNERLLDSLREAEEENTRLVGAMREILEECENSGYPNQIVAERMIDRIQEYAWPWRPVPAPPEATGGGS